MTLNQKIFQTIGSLILLLWGGILIYYYQTGKIDLYLSRFFPSAALAGAIILIILGLFNILTLGHKIQDCGSCHADHDHDHDHDHSHSHDHDHSHSHGHGHSHDHSHDHAEHTHASDAEDNIYHHQEQDTPIAVLVTFFILAIPISYAAAYSPGQFTLGSIERKGGYTQDYSRLSESVPSALRDLSKDARANPGSSDQQPADTADGSGDPDSTAEANTEPNYYDPYTIDDVKERVGTTAEGALLLDVVEIFYTAGDREMQNILDGQDTEFSAQVIPEKVNNPDGTRLRVMQLYVQCCLADARPFSIPIEFGKSPPEYREMGWYKITGKISYRVEDGTTVPVIHVAKFAPTTEPSKANMYY